MTDHMTEEEQLEALKRWWKENGKLIVLVVVLAAGGYFGWGAWQDQQRAQAEAASARYEELLNGLQSEDGNVPSDLVAKIKAEQGGDLYGYNAALIQAKAAVDEGDLDAAVDQLRWILNQTPDTAMEQLARLRLARVLAAQGSFDEALAQLEQVQPADSFVAAYAETRGDILLEQGATDQARVAYQSALENLGERQQSRATLLQMKLDNLKTAAASEQAASGENAS